MSDSRVVVVEVVLVDWANGEMRPVVLLLGGGEEEVSIFLSCELILYCLSVYKRVQPIIVYW